ncbi:MAG: hypothetical protein WD425_10715 [Nitrospirales bacterium]
MSDRRRTVLKLVAAACAIPAAFFTYYGIQLIYAAITFEGEGSLGHVGMYIAAILFPLLALFFGGMTMLAWRRSKMPSPSRPPA